MATYPLKVRGAESAIYPMSAFRHAPWVESGFRESFYLWPPLGMSFGGRRGLVGNMGGRPPITPMLFFTDVSRRLFPPMLHMGAANRIHTGYAGDLPPTRRRPIEFHNSNCDGGACPKCSLLIAGALATNSGARRPRGVPNSAYRVGELRFCGGFPNLCPPT